ncbi:dehydrodolichyl diphosphate synthase complex subunit NUS1 isoform X1 [Punica granatum]|uniref:ditrans,polycis-polyprenyl diphosphate synthase [(2E,6E)-farnesyldiphosphate specific] n=1 Tax=Punica granatum TaxID=22663 RepID=A0A6P8EAR5_PUNGR|nr:dehydrodolichyl diphosphate synthase complex subunit NUS1 isoform X1 [Punica granatum]
MVGTDTSRRSYIGIARMSSLAIHLLWLLIHLVISIFFFVLKIANVLESYLISSGFLKKYESINVGKLRYLAVVVDSEDALQINKVIKLVQWLADIGVKHVCLYDNEGILKKSKDIILKNLSCVKLFEEGDEQSLRGKKTMSLEFASQSDGKEALAKAANLLLKKHLKLRSLGENQEEKIFTEAHMTEALRAVGSGGPEPDLLLVYGPVRCHLGFPAWRLRYTEIVHMGPLKSLKYGSLLKAIYKFTLVRQNYGK